MIRTTILTLAVGLTLSAPSLAQEDGKKRGPKGGEEGKGGDGA